MAHTWFEEDEGGQWWKKEVGGWPFLTTPPHHLVCRPRDQTMVVVVVSMDRACGKYAFPFSLSFPLPLLLLLLSPPFPLDVVDYRERPPRLFRLPPPPPLPEYPMWNVRKWRVPRCGPRNPVGCIVGSNTRETQHWRNRKKSHTAMAMESPHAPHSCYRCFLLFPPPPLRCLAPHRSWR